MAESCCGFSLSFLVCGTPSTIPVPSLPMKLPLDSPWGRIWKVAGSLWPTCLPYKEEVRRVHTTRKDPCSGKGSRNQKKEMVVERPWPYAGYAWCHCHRKWPYPTRAQFGPAAALTPFVGLPTNTRLVGTHVHTHPESIATPPIGNAASDPSLLAMKSACKERKQTPLAKLTLVALFTRLRFP